MEELNAVVELMSAGADLGLAIVENGRFVYTSHSMETNFGTEGQTLQGDEVEKIFPGLTFFLESTRSNSHPEGKNTYPKLGTSTSSGQKWRVDYRFSFKKLTGEGRDRFVIVFSEQKKQSGKDAFSSCQIAGRIGHDLDSLCTIFSGYLRMLHEKIKQKPVDFSTINAYINILSGTSHRIKSLAIELSDHGRKSADKPSCDT